MRSYFGLRAIVRILQGLRTSVTARKGKSRATGGVPVSWNGTTNGSLLGSVAGVQLRVLHEIRRLSRT
jgi:hypothetical protein